MKLWSSVRIPGVSAKRELSAGLTLAAVGIPISMGYSSIAHMPLSTGLWAMILPGIVYAAFGSSRHLVVSADSASAAILGAGLLGLAPEGSQNYVALAGLVAGLTGVFLLLARILRLGFVANFLSRSLLVGLLVGVGISVASGQIPKMLGMSTRAHNPIPIVVSVINHIDEISLPTLIVSLATLTLLVFGRRLKKVSMELVVVVLGIAVVSLGWLHSWSIATVGTMKSGLPSVSWPKVPHGSWPHLIGLALSLSVVILTQSSSVARAFAVRHEERLDVDHDLVGLGLANMASMASGSFVINSSVTKTELSDRLGSQSQRTSLIGAVVALIVVFTMTGPLSQLPAAVLGSVVFFIAVNMTHIGSLVDIYRRRRDEFIVAAVTAISVIVIGMETGILISIALCLLNHIRHGYHPKTGLVGRDDAGHWVLHPLAARVQIQPGIFLYRFQSGLYYANVEQMLVEVRDLCEVTPAPRCICVDVAATVDIDYTTGLVLAQLVEYVNDRQIHFAFVHVIPEVKLQLESAGLVETELLEFDAHLRDVFAKYARGTSRDNAAFEESSTALPDAEYSDKRAEISTTIRSS